MPLWALSHLHAFAGADAAEARGLLHKAIELDPASSYAHSLLALSHFHDALADWTKDPPRALTANCNQRTVRLSSTTMTGCLTRCSVSPFSGPAATMTGL